MGEKCARLFDGALGTTLEGLAANITTMLATATGPVSANGVWQDAVTSAARAAGMRYPTRGLRMNGKIPASIASYKRGEIGTIAAELFPEPAVVADAPPNVDISLSRTADGKLSFHILSWTNMPLPDW
jgi:hypothetical protein